MVGHDWVGGMSRHFWDGEYWHPPHRRMSLGPRDQDVKALRCEEDVPPASVLGGVELGSRQGCQVRLPEHGEESESEAHPQGQSEVLQAWREGAELMEKWGKDGQTS